MKSKRGVIVLLVALVVVIAAASAGYASLSGQEEIRQEASQSNTMATQQDEASLQPATDFTVRDSKWDEVALSQLRGKPVVVNFWATWCPYCVIELPLFQSAYEQYGDRIQFMIVDLADGARETASQADDYVRENGYTFPVYYEDDDDSLYAYGITGIPVTLAVDADGNLVAMYRGALAQDDIQHLASLLLD